MDKLAERFKLSSLPDDVSGFVPGVTVNFSVYKSARIAVSGLFVCTSGFLPG